MNNDNKNHEFDELQENLNRIDLLTKRLVLTLANKNNDTDYSKPNQELYYKAASKYFSYLDKLMLKLARCLQYNNQ